MNRPSLHTEAAALMPQSITDYETLHAYAETGFDLPKTTAYVVKRLKDMGYVPKPCGKSGIVAVLGDKTADRTILLRCDMDALPIHEETGLPYAAQNGNMHACGHDMHTAMLLGAAALLKSYEAELHGAVKLCFQPAEERISGAADMLQNGLLDAPTPDCAVAVHVMTATPIPTGTVIIPPYGISAPAAAMFHIVLRGKGCHGASPHLGIDPLPAAAHCLAGLQTIIARELPMGEAAALTIGSIHGGGAANAIAEEATLSGSLRAFDDACFHMLKERIAQVTDGIAAAHRVQAEVAFDSECPTLRNDADFGAKIAAYLQEMLPQGVVMDANTFDNRENQKQKGSEDFACISHKMPSVMLALAAGCVHDGFTHPLHSPKMTLDTQAMQNGICAYGAAALGYLR